MTTRPPRRPSCRPPRRLVAGIAVALAAALSIGATGGAEPVGTLAPSSNVEMLGTENGAGAITLAALRQDVFAWAPWNNANGAGVDVAVIDTGVAPVAGLSGPGKVLHGPDLSFEAGSKSTAYLDTYGHGTHMAAIIAGTRPGAEGIAPLARIVSIKTAGRDGVTTVPQVVAAIDWVVEHRNTNGLNIRVLNLSLGQSGISNHRGDALSAAAERAWKAGIVVVVAGGNDGTRQAYLDSPAIDPYVIAVGAVDSTTEPWNKTGRSVPGWSAMGNGSRNPDLASPGRSIASYRVPGSTLDTTFPNARYGTDLFLGSGTSQAAAVTSGIAASLISTYPTLTPDQVKQTLRGRTFPINYVPATKQGAGHVDGSATVGNAPITSGASQSFPSASGSGTGITAPKGATWSGGGWSGATWSGATWSGTVWSGATWSGATWSGATWSGATWSGATWSGATWSGATWSGATWSGATWSGATWSGQGWTS